MVESGKAKRGAHGLGLCIWLTGLPAAGKSSIADGVAAEVSCAGLEVVVLDGDSVRAAWSPPLGYSKADRDTQVARLAEMARRRVSEGAVVLVAAVSPYSEARRRARSVVEQNGGFFEVHVSAALSTCAERDPKGLYAKARAGEITGLTGVDDPYEAPTAPDLVLETDRDTAEESCRRLMSALDERRLLPERARGPAHVLQSDPVPLRSLAGIPRGPGVLP